MKYKCGDCPRRIGDCPRKFAAFADDFSPTFGTMKDDGAGEFGGDSKLGRECLAHRLGDCTALEAVKAYFADAVRGTRS